MGTCQSLRFLFLFFLQVTDLGAWLCRIQVVHKSVLLKAHYYQYYRHLHVKADLHPPPALFIFFSALLTLKWYLHISDTHPSSGVLLRSPHAWPQLCPAPPCSDIMKRPTGSSWFSGQASPKTCQ